MVDTIRFPIKLQVKELESILEQRTLDGKVGFRTFYISGDLKKRAAYESYTSNPTKVEKEQGIYVPRVTIIRRKPADSLMSDYKEPIMEIETSAQKFIFGHSIYEPTKRDTPIFANKMKDFLWNKFGIRRDEEEIIQAIPNIVHIAKNIILKDTQGFIRAFNRLGKDRRYDRTEDYYIDEGIYFKHRLQDDNKTGVVAISFSRSADCIAYDKFLEMISPARNTYQTAQEKELIRLKEQHSCSYSLARIEVRLKNRQAKDRKYARYSNGKIKDFTIADIFDESINKQILLGEIEKIIGDIYLKLSALSESDFDEMFAFLTRKAGVKKLSCALATVKLAELIGERGKTKAKDALIKNGIFASKTVERFINTIEPFLVKPQLVNELPLFTAESEVVRQLREFKPITSLEQVFKDCRCNLVANQLAL